METLVIIVTNPNFVLNVILKINSFLLRRTTLDSPYVHFYCEKWILKPLRAMVLFKQSIRKKSLTVTAPTKIRFAGWSSPFAMGGHNRGDWESGENWRGEGGRKRERSPEFLSTILVPSLRAEMRWKTAPSWDRLTFSLRSTRILTLDFEHYCGSPIFQTCPNHGAGSRGNRARENHTKLQVKKNVHRAEIPPARKRKNTIK